MALSVSGFPEPLRQLPESDVETSILSNNPRLRGLFGKKLESSRSPTRQNTEESIYTPPSPPNISPRSSQIPTLSSEEQAFLVQMTLQTPEPLPTVPQRPRQISLTRRTPPPSAGRQASLNRLEIGMGPRAPAGSPPLHTLPKPPTVVVQEWSKAAEPTLPLPRPLPAVPGPIIESSKSAAMRNMQHRPPVSKVLMASSSRPRAQTTTPHAISVRYQPMVAEPSEKESAQCPSASTSTPLSLSPTSSPNANTSPGSHVRPLPRIPPASTTSTIPPVSVPRYVPRPARVKRPKTSPSSSDGFSTNVRSPFDAVPSSWASRPVDLNPSGAGQSPPPSAHTGPSNYAGASNHAGPSGQPAPSRRMATPRTRSHSRPRRRDHSADALSSGSRTPTTASRRPAHRVTSPSPILPTPGTTPPASARNSASIWASTYHIKPPYSPTSSPKITSATPLNNRFFNDRGALITAPPSRLVEEKSLLADALTISDRSLHLHPVERLSSDEPSPISQTPESPDLPVEVFTDDKDFSSILSRSPSPMRYARPSSRGSLSDDSLPRSRSRSRTIRDQLRSYRRSYRGPKSPSRSPSPIRYARRSSLDGLDEPTIHLSPKRRAQPRSYQFDYKAAQASSPFIKAATSASSTDGKAEGKAGSTRKSKRAKSKGSDDSRPSRSRSPRWSRVATPTGSVIDISPAAVSYEEMVQNDVHLVRGQTSLGRLSEGAKPSESFGDTIWHEKLESHGEMSDVEEKRWMYGGDGAVVVTTLQPSRPPWQEEEVKRVIPKLRHLKLVHS